MNSSAVRELWRSCVAAARTMIGVPDYERYVAHLRACHPDRTVPTYAEFFAERQRARYVRGAGRCC